jgi:hypothetical protein
MVALARYPNRLVVSAVLGNCTGFVGSASVVAVWAVASGEASGRGPFYLALLAVWFGAVAWLVGLAYLIAVVPILTVVRRFAPPSYVAVVGLLLGAAPGPGFFFLFGGSYFYGSAGLAHGVVAAIITCWLAYFRWGVERSGREVTKESGDMGDTCRRPPPRAGGVSIGRAPDAGKARTAAAQVRPGAGPQRRPRRA